MSTEETEITTYSIIAAPRRPITAPKVSARGIRVGIAPPADPVVFGLVGPDVMCAEGVREPEPEAGADVLWVPLTFVIGVTVPEIEADEMEALLLLLPVLDGELDELDEDGWFSMDTRILAS